MSSIVPFKAVYLFLSDLSQPDHGASFTSDDLAFSVGEFSFNWVLKGEGKSIFGQTLDFKVTRHEC